MSLAVCDYRTRMTDVGLVLPEGLSFEEWREVLAQVVRLNRASSWALADAVLYASRQAAYGSRYEEALEQTGLAYGRLRDLASLAAGFLPERRRVALSVAHHATVRALPPVAADRLLHRAELERWSVVRLRRHVRERAPSRLPTEQPRDAARNETRDLVSAVALDLCVPLTPDRERAYEAAAGRAGLELVDWLLGVCDAASELLATG